MIPKSNPVQSKKLRQSARGQECTLNIAGVCNYDSETVVLCHFPSDITGSKSTDISSGFGCDRCHAAIDGREKLHPPLSDENSEFYMRRAMVRTWHVWIDMGLVKIA